MDDVLFAPAYQVAAAIRERHLSASEVLDAYLAQIAHHNTALNAIVTLATDDARARAQAADAALAHGHVWGPLHGVPITLEDCHAVAGIRSTWGGFAPLTDHIPTEDSTVAARLKAAGAILLGKTNGPAVWPDSLFGITNNPWDMTRTPGGSSAGLAAAVAAGLTTLDIGLDTTGSIQNPAHYCGIFGMRPTEHRVPLTGSFFIDPVRKFRIMSVVGPMARSVEDLQLLLPIIAGPDGRDFDVPPVPWQTIASPPLHSVRIAWAAALPGMPIADEIRTAIEHFAQDLLHMGGIVEPRLPNVHFLQQAQLADHLFERIAGALMPMTEPLQVNPLDDYVTALDQRDALMRTWDHFFTEWDVLICPVGASTASRHSDTSITINNQMVPDDQRLTLHLAEMITPITGCPTIVMPLGRDQHGLPFGVQVVGRRWNDERLLAIAAQMSAMLGGFQRPTVL
jgi:amidase